LRSDPDLSQTAQPLAGCPESLSGNAIGFIRFHSVDTFDHVALALQQRKPSGIDHNEYRLAGVQTVFLSRPACEWATPGCRELVNLSVSFVCCAGACAGTAALQVRHAALSECHD
jgi:hypothetical protein